MACCKLGCPCRHATRLARPLNNAIPTCKAEFTLVTEDAHFDLLAQLVPGLDVLFYDRDG